MLNARRRRLAHVARIGVALVCGWSRTLGAQNSLTVGTLPRDASIRFMAPPAKHWLSGKFREVRNDTIFMSNCKCNPEGVSVQTLSRLQIRRGWKSHGEIGFLVGLGAGVVIAARTGANHALVAGENGRANLTPLVVGSSAAIGTVLGLLWWSPRWTEVPLAISTK
jgi:hypothetical protein